MDNVKFGSVVRAVRRRRGWRQLDVAARAGVGQWAVSRVERGDLDRLPLGTIRRICAALEIGLAISPRWRGGELPRLVDRRHAAMVETISALLLANGWEVVPEFTFNHYGEIGAVDVLGWHQSSKKLAMVEVKSEFDDLQNMLSAMDRKLRLVPDLLIARRGWQPAATGVILVLPDGSTERDFVANHASIFASAFPARTVEVRRWLLDARTSGCLRGIWFLRPSDLITVAGIRQSPRRVAKADRPIPVPKSLDHSPLSDVITRRGTFTGPPVGRPTERRANAPRFHARVTVSLCRGNRSGLAGGYRAGSPAAVPGPPLGQNR